MTLQKLIDVARELDFVSIDITEYDLVIKHKYRDFEIVIKDNYYGDGNKIIFNKINNHSTNKKMCESYEAMYDDSDAYFYLDDTSKSDMEYYIRDEFNYFRGIFGNLGHICKDEKFSNATRKIKDINDLILKSGWFSKECCVNALHNPDDEDKHFIRIIYNKIDYKTEKRSHDSEFEIFPQIELKYENNNEFSIYCNGHGTIKFTHTSEYPFDEILNVIKDLI